MEIDISQNNSNPATPAANSTPYTLLESNRQGSQSRPLPAPSAPSMPYVRPIRQTLRDPAFPAANLDAGDRSKLRADADTSADYRTTRKLKRMMKKTERPRNTRRQHSNPNVMNASAGRQPTRLGRHLQKLKLQVLPPCSDHDDDATTAAQYHRRRRRRGLRFINPNPSGDHDDERHELEREPQLEEPDLSLASEPSAQQDDTTNAPYPDLNRTIIINEAEIDQRILRRTVTFEENELDKACESGDPLDPEAPRDEPPQPGPSHLPARTPTQIHRTVPFDEDELSKACESGDPFDPEAPRAEPPQPGPDNLPEGPPEQIDAHEPPLTTTNAISTPDDGFIQARRLHIGVNIATMYPPHQLGYSASTSCSALSSLRPSFHIGPPSISITNECIDAQTTGETQPTGDKCTYTCHKMPQHTYDQLIRATATLLILWSQFWKWRRIKKKACYNYNR